MIRSITTLDLQYVHRFCGFKIDHCPLCSIALNENGVCPKCGYKK